MFIFIICSLKKGNHPVSSNKYPAVNKNYRYFLYQADALKHNKSVHIATSLSSFESDKIGRQLRDKQNHNKMNYVMTIKHFDNIEISSKNTSKSQQSRKKLCAIQKSPLNESNSNFLQT